MCENFHDIERTADSSGEAKKLIEIAEQFSDFDKKTEIPDLPQYQAPQDINQALKNKGFI